MVAHDADAPHVGEGGKILPEILVDARAVQLIPENEIRLLHDPDLGRRDLADDPDAEPRTRERLAHDQLLGDPQLKPDPADLVLKQHPERLDRLLVEAELADQRDREPADVVVGFDDVGRLSVAALHHVRVDRALGDVADEAFHFLRLVAEDLREDRADHLALGLRVRFAHELHEEALPGVHAREIKIERAARTEDRLDLVALVLAHEPVVDEDAVELPADRAGEESGRDRGVDAAGEPQDHMGVPDLLAEFLYGIFGK